MFIDKKGVKCRNIQEQVEENRKDIVGIHDDIEDIYARISLVNAAFIEIDDTELVGQGQLTEEQLLKLNTLDYVYVVIKRAEDVYLAFGGEKYQEGYTILKSMSAGGYSRVINFDLEAGTWTYYETDVDIDALVQRIHELEAEKQDLLVGSGEGQNIKTINGNNIMGSGNIQINSGVSGVKGGLEENYRTGNVNITEENILDSEEQAAIHSGITEGKVSDYDDHIHDSKIHVNSTEKENWNGKLDETKCTFQTTAPTQAITDGGVHFVHLASSTGIREYTGYIYMYNED